MSDMDQEAQRRLWEFTLHEDRLFNERQNLFLVAESMLAVAYTTALVAEKQPVALIIGIVALAVSLMWFYVCARHSRVVELIQTKAKTTFPEYDELTEERKEKLRVLKYPSRWFVAYGVPPAIGALWVALLIVQG